MSVLSQIKLNNFLSFGPGEQTFDLRRLNVLIGPNGSGKSNLVEAFSVLRAVPRDLPLPIRLGGGVDEWLWRGGKLDRADFAELEILFDAGQVKNDGERVRYRVEFGSEAGGVVVLDERSDISSVLTSTGPSRSSLSAATRRAIPRSRQSATA